MLKLKRSRPGNETVLGAGCPLDDPLQIVQVTWPDEYRKGHFFCFGTTRIGKTRLMELMIEQDIRKGYSVVVVDPKGDIDLFSKIVQVAAETDREDELMLITPIYPQYSLKIDPLAYYYMPEEIVSHVISGIKAREEFFINVAYETTLVIVLSLLLFAKVKGERPLLNFKAIKERASYPDLEKLKEALKGLNTPESGEILDALNQVLSSPMDFFAKVSSSLRTVLTALTAGSVGEIIGKAEANRFIKRLEEGKRIILVVQTGSLLTRKTAHIVARVFLSMIQSFVGRLYASGRKVSPPMALYIDEASNVFYVGVEDLFNKAGGADVWVHAFTQSIADIAAEIGETNARKILDNTNTKLFMRVNDPKTAEYISLYSGDKRRFSPILSLGGNISVREMEEPRVRPEEILNLQRREFVFFSFDGAFKGKVARVPRPRVMVEYPRIEVV